MGRPAQRRAGPQDSSIGTNVNGLRSLGSSTEPSREILGLGRRLTKIGGNNRVATGRFSLRSGKSGQIDSRGLRLILPVQPRRRSFAGVSELPRLTAPLASSLAEWTVRAVYYPVVGAIDEVCQSFQICWRRHHSAIDPIFYRLLGRVQLFGKLSYAQPLAAQPHFQVNHVCYFTTNSTTCRLAQPYLGTILSRQFSPHSPANRHSPTRRLRPPSIAAICHSRVRQPLHGRDPVCPFTLRLSKGLV